MPDKNPPPSTDDALIRILRELGTIRTEFGAFRDQGERRHMLLVNELAEVRIEAKRATELAADAKRLADSAAHEMHDTQRAVVEHTRGLVDRHDAMETSVEGLRLSLNTLLAAETDRKKIEEAAEAERKKIEAERTVAMNTLLAAETDRKTREDERKKIEDARWAKIARWWPFLLAAATLASYAVGHWKP